MTEDERITTDRADALSPGTPLLQGQFLIDGFLNAGGFGITYLARDSLERRVVIKECFPSTMCCRAGEVVRARSSSQQGEFDEIVRLFGKEARRLAKLVHPNIVGVRDVFEDNGTAYMALDYIEGRDLLDVIDLEPDRLSKRDIVRLTLDLLKAISHVHTQGMLHRDISPDNVLLDQDNRPILIDFGAARDTARRKSRVLSALHVVKDGYSPQEFYLVSGEQNPASDLYALAATLYHLLTGEAPAYSHVRLAALAEQKPDPYVPLAGRVADYEPSFLTAIDITLNVFSKDRLQSATDWMAHIGEARAQAPSARLAHDDPAIDARIRKLVEDTNIEVRRLQELIAREAEHRARCAKEEETQREAAKRRRMEAARREAEEAAQVAAEISAACAAAEVRRPERPPKPQRAFSPERRPEGRNATVPAAVSAPAPRRALPTAAEPAPTTPQHTTARSDKRPTSLIGRMFWGSRYRQAAHSDTQP